MKKILAVAIIATAFSGQAFAADLPARTYTKAPPVVAAYDWSGFYIGANGGYGWGSDERTDLQANGGFWTAGPGSIGDVQTLKPSGAVYGGQIGYNWQFGNWVLGLEGQYDGADLNRTDPSIFNPGPSRWSSKIDSIATGTARLGYAFDNWLPYIKGGYAGAQLEATNTFLLGSTIPPSTASLDHNQWRNGFVIGGGLDYALARNWIIGIEYSYLDLGTETWSGTTIISNFLGPGTSTHRENYSDKLTISTVTARLSYKFDSGKY